MAFRILSFLAWLLSASVITWIAAHYAIYQDSTIIPLIGSMLSSNHLVERVAPIAILSVFTGALLEAAAKAFRIRRHYIALPSFDSIVQSGIDHVAPNDRVLLSKLVSRRAQLIVNSHNNSLSGIEEIIPATANLDANNITVSYISLNVYAWILPVLGFIGTASGLASAINGFKTSLQNTTDIEALLNSLSQSVIPGLSSAFHITILALAASLITYLCATSLKSWELGALSQLDRLSVDFLANTPTDIQQHHASQLALLESQLKLMSDINAKIVTVTQTHTYINAAAESLHQSSSTLTTSVETAQRSIGLLSRSLHHASEELRRTISSPLSLTLTRDGNPTPALDEENKNDQQGSNE